MSGVCLGVCSYQLISSVDRYINTETQHKSTIIALKNQRRPYFTFFSFVTRLLPIFTLMMFKIFLLVCLLSQRNACCRKRPKRLVILEMSSSSSPPPRVVLVIVLVIIIVISFHANRRARPPRLARLVFLLLPPWPVTFSALAAGFFPFTIGFSYSNCLRLHALAMGNIFFRAFSMGYAQPPLPPILRSSKPSLRATAFTPFAFGDIFCNAYHG